MPKATLAGIRRGDLSRSRGNRKEKVFDDDRDCENFLKTLGEDCWTEGWQFHAFWGRGFSGRIGEIQEDRRILAEELKRHGMSPEVLQELPLMDRRKGLIAGRNRAETKLTMRWIAENLHAGTPFPLANTIYWRNSGGNEKVRD